MKTIELVRTQTAASEEQIQETGQQTIFVTIGDKPTAMLLPMIDNITHLAEFKQIIDSEEIITLTMGGKPAAILQTLVPLVVFDEEEVDLEAATLSTNPKFLELIEQAQQRLKTTGGISSEKYAGDWGKAIQTKKDVLAII
jgi:hypothetical protein